MEETGRDGKSGGCGSGSGSGSISDRNDMPRLTGRVEADQWLALVGVGGRAAAGGLAQRGGIASPFGLAALVAGVILASHACGGWNRWARTVAE